MADKSRRHPNDIRRAVVAAFAQRGDSVTMADVWREVKAAGLEQDFRSAALTCYVVDAMATMECAVRSGIVLRNSDRRG